jgi:hypothetical protein
VTSGCGHGGNSRVDEIQGMPTANRTLVSSESVAFRNNAKWVALEVLISDHDEGGKSARSFDVHTETVADVFPAR